MANGSSPDAYPTTKPRTAAMLRRPTRKLANLSSTLIGPGVGPSSIGTGIYIDKYRVVEQIGQGSMGVVYRGEHLITGRKVAIKQLRAQHRDSDCIVTRFLAEATASARIGHPGIVEIYDAGTHTDGSAYLVMEFLAGTPLTKLVRHKRLSLPAAVDLARQLAVTLAAAHEVGIVHRDLKPDNVFVVADRWEPAQPRVKVIDFGVAKFLFGSPNMLKTNQGTVMGTPVYMSPEQAAGAATVDSRSDIYSLGCILYEAICGRVPFSGTVADVLMGHLHGEPIPPRLIAAGVAPPLNNLVLRMLAKSPDDRPLTMCDVDAALAAIEPSL